jgi:hypothetical protein
MRGSTLAKVEAFFFFFFFFKGLADLHMSIGMDEVAKANSCKRQS